jgi:hypothetical protein
VVCTAALHHRSGKHSHDSRSDAHLLLPTIDPGLASVIVSVRCQLVERSGDERLHDVSKNTRPLNGTTRTHPESPPAEFGMKTARQPQNTRSHLVRSSWDLTTYESRRWDSNPRLPASKAGALAAALRLVAIDRDGGIRTHVLSHPKRARYQTAPHPEMSARPWNRAACVRARFTFHGLLYEPMHRARVGMAGFEPTSSCIPSRRATKLRHIPINALEQARRRASDSVVFATSTRGAGPKGPTRGTVERHEQGEAGSTACAGAPRRSRCAAFACS